MGTLRQASKILSLFEDTPDEQIQAVLASGFLADLRDGNIAEISRDSFRRMCGLKLLNPPLLERIGTVTIGATERFLAREKFVVDTSRKAKVKIAWLGGNFKNQFLEKAEAPTPEMTLCYARLVHAALDSEIRKEIGTGCEEATLAAIWTLMERQPNGKTGVLLTNGYANIFYVRDTNGTFWAVHVHWFALGGGWRVSARSVSRPHGWGGGGRVFSQVA